MRAGRLRGLVTLQRSTPTQDSDSGEEIEVWAALGTAYANIEPMEAKEVIARGLKMDEQATMFTFRYSADWSDLDPNDRIVFDSKNYDLESSVRVGHRNEKMEAIGVIRG